MRIDNLENERHGCNQITRLWAASVLNYSVRISESERKYEIKMTRINLNLTNSINSKMLHHEREMEIGKGRSGSNQTLLA